VKTARWLGVLALLCAAGLLWPVSHPAISTGSALAEPAFAYALTNDGGLRFLDEYQRFGGVTTLGYPASNRFQLPDGFTYQLTQGALLQWRPELDAIMLANTFEMLEPAGEDDWLYAFKGVPRPIQDDGSGGDWQKAKETRLGWLTNEPIKSYFLANPNPSAIRQWTLDDSIQLYGLPMSQPERFGPFICQRFQRVSLQLWVEQVEGMPAPGTVVRVLGGDLLKEAGLIPPDALEAGDRPTPTATATATPIPPTATRAPSRPRPAATATATATATPTSVPIPTPDPNHPPEQGTFTGYFDFQGGLAVYLVMEVASPGYSRQGPFHNLALSQNWVGKTLIVNTLSVDCPQGRICDHPYVWLYRSNVGELRNGMDLIAPRPDREVRLLPRYDAEDVATEWRGGSPFSWKIEYGQYFLFWFTGSPGIAPSGYPESVTYSVEVR